MNSFLGFFSKLSYIAYRAQGNKLVQCHIDGTSDHTSGHVRNCKFNFCPSVIYGNVYLVKSKVVLSSDCLLLLDGNSIGPSFPLFPRRFHRLKVFKLHLLILAYEPTPQGFLLKFSNASRRKNWGQTLKLAVGTETNSQVAYTYSTQSLAQRFPV